MHVPRVSGLSLYKIRFVLLYLVFILVLAYLLTSQLGEAPLGLSQDEMNSAVTSANLGSALPMGDTIINLPYHLLQKASLMVLGLSPLAIKLPSLVLAGLTALGLVGILRRFFRLGATSITALLAIASTPFLVMGRTGVPTISLSFLIVTLIIAGAFILGLRQHRLIWKAIAILAAVFLLYTPLGIYPLLALILATVFHPHLRYHVVHTRWPEWLALTALAAAGLSLLVIGAVNQPSLLLQLAGLPTGWPSWSGIGANLSILSGSLFNVANPRFGYIPQPLFGLPLLILIVLGILQIFRDSFSARAYVLIGWLVVFFIILSVNAAHVLDLFVPAVLLLAVGVETLLHEWYKLFPRNPYARIGAVIPLTILILGISVSEIARYFDGYRYGIDYANSSYSLALDPLKQQLTQTANQPTYLIVPSEQLGFYQLLKPSFAKLVVTDEYVPLQPTIQVIVVRGSRVELSYPIDSLRRIVASPLKDRPLLFGVYQTNQ